MTPCWNDPSFACQTSWLLGHHPGFPDKRAFSLSSTSQSLLPYTMNSLLRPRRKPTMTGRATSSNTPPPEPDSIDDANISSSDYAKKCKKLMDLHRDLRALGAGMMFDLPRIAVIGGQSAGKSSLVEAVSGINVPRDSGTCTRCPMECSMSSTAESWSCEISLRFEYDNSGNSLNSSRVVKFGPLLTDKNEMDIWLRRAQTAILCPHLPPENFHNKSRDELRNMPTTDPLMLKFSRNIVCVDLNDPDSTDLSFVDLPGLIQNGPAQTIELVRSLVVSHIGSENTLILVTIPMSDDMENQQAVLLADQADPGGERTIGVLTKPDTVGKGATGSRQKWKEVIQGQAHPLKHGYYCVRLPDDDERSRNITRIESQRLAAEFFDSTSPWSDLADRTRFGIPGFVSDISRLLVGLIENTLPKLRSDVNLLLTKCQDELSELPAPVTNEPSAEILLRITNFCKGFSDAVLGDNHKVLARDNRRRYIRFMQDIRNTVPDFRPFVDHSKYIKPVFSDDETTDTIISELDSASKPLNLLDIRRVIDGSIAWELPKHVPYEATKVLILQFTCLWREPSISCFEAVFEILSSFMDNLMKIHFGQFKQLQSYVGSLIHEDLNDCKEEAIRTLKKLLELETIPIYTQNTHYLESEGKKWLTKYSEVRRHPTRYEIRAPTPTTYHATDQPYFIVNDSTNYDLQAIQALARAGYKGLTVEELARRLSLDDFHDELAVMAKVRAYFQVAYKRIIDYVPMVIEHELNQALAARLQSNLFQSLLKDPNSSERMRDLLSEDPIIANKREFLGGRMKRLIEIKQKLDNFGRDSVA